ncbi:MAG: leucine--tRNA ligase [Parcubacteria group bacterium]|nr:leucine--tRNA ligase [Parcubacteria group bacterium]MCR4342643.1 leucine--tRNA ligase [Patescibacteria group bacterium]
MKKYDHKKIEKKWQKEWEKKGIYKVKDDYKKPKYYVLDMFPYPSGEGLHVGHIKGYITTDVYARYKKMSGFNVLHPMGWDAFGLPAENYAIKHKINPKISTARNVATYKKQLSGIGFNYDWSREINTTDPEYYKWTQWIFLQLFKAGLAYESYEPIIWCPSCKTGLALEDLEDGKCERCGSDVEKKPMRQWVLAITKYADRLLEDLKLLDWPVSIKESQKNWIGRSEGALIKFPISNFQFPIEVFTTRVDTIFGCTYLVVAPEHPIFAAGNLLFSNVDEVNDYIAKSKRKGDVERMAESKEKSGVELKGVKAINPFNNEEIPIFVADYVLGHYGTGAVMAVPAHDTRDWQFAKKYDLSIRESVKGGDVSVGAFVEDGTLVVSGEFTGLASSEARKEMAIWLKKNKAGRKTVNYKLQDWVFSRQRYWGEPIPLIHCDKCGVVPVPEGDLPVKLPEVKSYEPTGTGESPLANILNWINIECPKCGGKGKRETNTMPQWAGSSWYYLRYIDPKNKKRFVDAKKEKYWMGKNGVDMYVGGTEHATRHLIYVRFWHKFLFDMRFVSTKEPFYRLANQGLVMGEDGRKMSKRWGNVVNPDEVASDLGADTLRVYEMFMGPFEQAISWSTGGMMGSRRFLERVWKLKEDIDLKAKNKELESLLHKTIKKVTEDIENFRFNTAISTMMIFINETEKAGAVPRVQYMEFLKLLSPFAPHVTEEIWHELGHKKSIHIEKWPKYSKAKIKEKSFMLVVQINGKVRDQFEAPLGLSEEDVKDLTLKRENVTNYIKGNSVKRIIWVPDKLINIVI